MKLLNNRKRGLNGNTVYGKQPFRVFHTAEAMRWVLDRERVRADRTGEEFSVVLFDTTNGKKLTDNAMPIRLAKLIVRRMRATDDVGWFVANEKIGLVLAHTSGEGAWKMANEISEDLSKKSTNPKWEVYTYPSDWLPAENHRVYKTDENDDAQSGIQAMETLFIKRTPLWKRAFDIIGASVGLVVLSPVFAAVAFLVKLSGPGPVLFKQKRAGLGGVAFEMYKFRSMNVDAELQKRALMDVNEQDGPAFKIKDDPRVTPVGRLLRKTSVDELPQLWNVLKGEMSLVGPRPLPCIESNACVQWQRQRLDISPGLTCIWQVRGRSAVSFAEWVRMDMQYIRSRTLWHDLRLIVETAVVVFFRKGAY